jgi:predicted ArsR family transcriptional regulator
MTKYNRRKMQSTPGRIRQYLTSHPAATAGELSRALDMTIQNIRHHLNKLVHEGWVEIHGGQKPEGRGRTAVVYRLNRDRSPNNLAILADALVASLRDQLEPSLQERCLRKAAEMLAQPARDTPPRPVTRLNQVIDRLNQLNYHARWEAGPDGPRIILTHRPYGSLCPDHPELEALDLYVVETLLHTPVRRIQPSRRRELQTAYMVLLVDPGNL